MTNRGVGGCPPCPLVSTPGRSKDWGTDLLPPWAFISSQSQASLGYLARAGDSMNPDQREAVARALQMQDYALVLGMPGTGKTTTIVHIVKALMLAGCSILITR